MRSLEEHCKAAKEKAKQQQRKRRMEVRKTAQREQAINDGRCFEIGTTALETQLIFDCVLIYTSLSHIIISLRGPSKLHGGAYEILQGGNAYINLLQSCRRNFERQRKLDCLLSRIYPR